MAASYVRQTTDRNLSVPSEVTRDLIAYIGNKRRLLPFLRKHLDRLEINRSQPVFLDPFCGSGAVSRLARSLGWVTHANDWEPYSAILTGAALRWDRSALTDQIGQVNIDTVLASLNHEGDDRVLTEAECYVSRHYAPSDTDHPLIGRERLFFTAENARFVDRVRWQIEERFPAGGQWESQRELSLAALLYQVATHANTSGVFKAYHRGFGGIGRDALPRIMAPMKLRRPGVPDGPLGTVSCQDALEFLGRTSGDVCYLDPPYSTHQYGSNYFMLNTIALWDRPQVDDTIDENGRLRTKAGIRPDWTRTRSRFCSRSDARDAFSQLVDGIDSRYLMLSYSSDGLVDLDEMVELLSSQGRLETHIRDYTTYRGGRQSNTRRNVNAECLFVVDRSRKGGQRDRDQSRQTILKQEIQRTAVRLMCTDRLGERFTVTESAVELTPGWVVPVHSPGRLALEEVPELGLGQLKRVRDGLSYAGCRSVAEELDLWLKLVEANPSIRSMSDWQQSMKLLRKLAHPRYQDEFTKALKRFRAAVLGVDQRDRLLGELDALDRQARQRINGSLRSSP